MTVVAALPATRASPCRRTDRHREFALDGAIRRSSNSRDPVVANALRRQHCLRMPELQGRENRRETPPGSASRSGACSSPAFLRKAVHCVRVVGLSVNVGVRATRVKSMAVPQFRKGGEHSRRERPSIEFEPPREQPDVVEVLHPAVLRTEIDHRMELRRDDCLARVAGELRLREVEKRWIGNLFRRWRDDIAEAHV
jgi:hypothetical protein